jgi:hypothetical protein
MVVQATTIPPDASCQTGSGRKHVTQNGRAKVWLPPQAGHVW